MENDVWILWSYTILWVIAIFFQVMRIKSFDVVSFIYLLNLYCGLCAVSLYSDSLHTINLSASASIYLFIVLFMLTFPIRTSNVYSKVIVPPNKLLVYSITLVIVISGLLIFPRVLSSFQTGIFLIMTDESGGRDLYQDTIANADMAGRKVGSLSTIIFNAFSDIAILLFFYYMSFPKLSRKKWVSTGLAGGIILAIMQPIAFGLRGHVIIELMTCVAAYLLFKNRYSERIRQRIRKIGIIVALLVSIPLFYITLSRFNDVSSSIVNYSGQAVINFNEHGLEANGIRYGDRVLPLFKKIIGIQDVPNNYVERRFKYSHMTMDDSVFYTFVGDFTLDFGPVGGFLFGLLLTVIVYLSIISNRFYTFSDIIPLFFIICVCVQGAMYLFAYGDIGGNLKILVYIFVYSFAKITENERESNSIIFTTVPPHTRK